MMQAAIGWFVVAVGALIFLVPALGWPGVVVMAAGSILILRGSRWARRHFVSLARRHPTTAGRYRRWIAGKRR